MHTSLTRKGKHDPEIPWLSNVSVRELRCSTFCYLMYSHPPSGNMTPSTSCQVHFETWHHRLGPHLGERSYGLPKISACMRNWCNHEAPSSHQIIQFVDDQDAILGKALNADVRYQTKFHLTEDGKLRLSYLSLVSLQTGP